MMGVVQMMKNVIGVGGGEDIDALTAELDTARSAGSRACAELERLEAARRAAESYQDAKEIDEKIAEVRWAVDHIAALVPQLEERLRIARNTRQAEAVARHVAINRKAWPKFRAALLAAVDAQAAVIADREVAVAEIGEHAASMHLPFLAFRGFLYRDLFDIYAAELDRVYAEPAAKPAVVASRIASVQPRPVTAGSPRAVRLDEPTHAAPPRAKPRPLRRDKVSVGGRLVTMLRNGVEIDGEQTVTGDVVSVTMAQADSLLRAGAVELVSANVVSKGEPTP